MTRVLKWMGLTALGLIVTVLVVLGVLYLVTAPEGPPEGSASVAALESEPYRVGRVELTFVDESRPTPANGAYEGDASRTLATSVWYPREAVPGGSPLVIYSHGFMSNRSEGRYIAVGLAARGYVVAAPDFPLTHTGAPGGPNPTDVQNQPGDVRFLIDRLLQLSGNEKPFPGELDPARIGVAGLSLGGLTSTLVGYHPRWHDERVRAVISIAGPAAMLTRRFFLTRTAPFLMIAGTADAVVDYERHAAIIPERAPQGLLLSIQGGSHIGFADIAEPALRLYEHPDSLACRALEASGSDAEVTDQDDPFRVLGTAADGINLSRTRLEICSRPLGRALHPGRQQMITRLAVASFFDAHFAPTPEARQAARSLLEQDLPHDFPEVSVTR